MRNEELIDPFFQEVPWEVIHDDEGKLVGEVFIIDFYLLPAEFVKEEGKQNDSIHRIRRARRAGTAEVQYSRRVSKGI